MSIWDRDKRGGLFLDQRDNRTYVAQRCRNKTVLNLYGYTGGFSVHAAAAGARRTDTVDISAPALEAARENFRLNDLPLRKAGFHATDAIRFLEKAAAEGRTWDVVICDPPSFAPKQSALDKALKTYQRLHRLAAEVVEPGGRLFAASCSSHVRAEAFLKTVQQGVRSTGRRFELDLQRGAGFDHPTLPAFPEGDYLKFVSGYVN